MLAKLFKLVGEQDQPSVGQGDHQHGDECRKESPDTPGVEFLEAEVPLMVALVQDPANQVTADHEEDVHSDEASRYHPWKGMVDHHTKHGHGSQTIYVRTILD